MPKYYIEGKRKLEGEITAQGAKNSVLPILAATILAGDECIIDNCPNLSDVKIALKILQYIGCKVKREGQKVIINSKNITKSEIPDDLMRKMRSSIMFLGPILGRLRRTKLCFPGGCELGPRPINYHLSALKELGVSIYEDYGCITCNVLDKTKSGEITLPFPSVGATENIMLFAATIKGTTKIFNAAKEPEIIDLQNFINKIGGKVSGAGTPTIIIEGKDIEKEKYFHGAYHKVMPDRIVCATYMAMAQITGGQLLVRDVDHESLNAMNKVFLESGSKIKKYKNDLFIKAPKNIKNVNSVMTMPYPGFPTDANPIISAYLTKAQGISIIIETVFQDRFKYIGEISRFGADIKVDSRVCIINGVKELFGANVEATDLRGGAALLIAGLGATGNTTIDNTFHIDRGYEDVIENINKLGGKIKLID